MPNKTEHQPDYQPANSIKQFKALNFDLLADRFHAKYGSQVQEAADFMEQEYAQHRKAQHAQNAPEA
jgi:hypothetical protein